MSEIIGEERRLGIALIGAGIMGRRHLKGYGELCKVQLDHANVVAIVDPNQEAAETAAEEAKQLLGVRPAVYSNFEQALMDDAVDALDIAADPRVHHSIAVAAMEAGRHVLCEKPLALTVRTARAMVESAQRNGMVLATGENYRRGGANRLAKAVLDTGLLGDVHLLRELNIGGDNQIILSPWRHRKDSGAIGLDMTIHYADIAEYLLGKIDIVWGRGIIAEPFRFPADGGSPIVADGEDAIIAGLRTESGIDVQLAYLPSGPGNRFRERVIHGTLGSMNVPQDRTDGDVVVTLGDQVISGQALIEMVGDAFQLSSATVAVLGPDGTGGKGTPWSQVDAGYLAVEIDDFVRAVLNNHAPEVDGVGGMRSLAIVLGILESGMTGEAVKVDDVVNGELHSYQDSIDEALMEW